MNDTPQAAGERLTVGRQWSPGCRADGGEAGADFPASVSVIVPVRNREQLIGPCLESILAAAARPLERGVRCEIIVADDGSADATPEVVRQIGSGSAVPVRLVTLAERMGPAGARNAALKLAQGELVVFVDSDEVVVEAFLEAHLAVHARARDVYGCGTIVSVPSLEAALSRPEPRIWDYSGASLDTANASVRREHLEAVGGFDPGFYGMGWMDLDLGRRLKKMGLRRVAVPGAVSYHIQPPLRTPEQLAARLEKERERGRSAVHFMARHPGLNARLAAQDTVLHRFLNWVFRLGGLVTEDNVLAWAEWARARGLTALEKMWLAGVINKAHLESLAQAKAERRLK